MATLKPQSNGASYINTVIGTLDVGAGLLHLVFGGPAQSPSRCTKCNSPPINGQCTNFISLTWLDLWQYNWHCTKGLTVMQTRRRRSPETKRWQHSQTKTSLGSAVSLAGDLKSFRRVRTTNRRGLQLAFFQQRRRIPCSQACWGERSFKMSVHNSVNKSTRFP